MILKKIVDSKLLRLNTKKQLFTLDQLKNKAYVQAVSRKNSFIKSLTKTDSIAVIAEIKKASPSKGIILSDFDYLRIANEYETHGASAISILTEEDFFLGHDRYLKEIRLETQMPILRKDFIIDEYQIYETKEIGADAILFICRLLDDKTLEYFYKIASEIGLDCLFETHNEDEVKRALNVGAKIIGINNRDLDNFAVDIKTSEKLISYIPKEIVKVSESGINTTSDVHFLQNIGVDAILVGEALMRADCIKTKLGEFIICSKY